MSLRQPGHRPSFLLLSGQIESSVLCVGLSSRPAPGIYRCPLPPGPGPVPPRIPASPQHLRGHSLLALRAEAVHVPFPLHAEGREGLPVLIHTPAETPLPALGRAALQAEHRLNEPWGGPTLGVLSMGQVVSTQDGFPAQSLLPSESTTDQGLVCTACVWAVRGGCECPTKRGHLVVLCPSGSHRSGH